MNVEVRYMVDGCGKKIPSTRTIIVRRNGEVVYQEKTQKTIEEVMTAIDKKEHPPI